MSICPPRHADTNGLINNIMASLWLPVLISLTGSAGWSSPCPTVCCTPPSFSPLLIWLFYYIFSPSFLPLFLPFSPPPFVFLPSCLVSFLFPSLFPSLNYLSSSSSALLHLPPPLSTLLIFTWHSAAGHTCTTTVLSVPICFHNTMIEMSGGVCVHRYVTIWDCRYVLICVMEDSSLTDRVWAELWSAR